MHEPTITIQHVDVGIISIVNLRAVTNFKIDNFGIRLVDKMMSVGLSRWKSRNHSKPKCLLPCVGDERCLTFKNVHELV